MVALKTKLAGSKGASMAGRRFIATEVPITKWEPGTMRYNFVVALRKRTARLFPGSPTPHKLLAKKLGISDDLAGKYLRGDRIPDLEDWKDIAGKLGLGHWHKLFDPPK